MEEDFRIRCQARIDPRQQTLPAGTNAGPVGSEHTPRATALLLPRPEGKADSVLLLLQELVGQDLRVIGWVVAEFLDEQRRAHGPGLPLREGVARIISAPRTARDASGP